MRLFSYSGSYKWSRSTLILCLDTLGMCAELSLVSTSNIIAITVVSSSLDSGQFLLTFKDRKEGIENKGEQENSRRKIWGKP